MYRTTVVAQRRFFFFQAEDGIRDLVRSRGLGDVYKRQEHKQPELLRLNPMGKLPILVDGDQAITEGAAIGLSLIHI